MKLIYQFKTYLVLKTQSSSQDALIRMLEEERDHFKRECEIMKTMRTRSASPLRTTTNALVGFIAISLSYIAICHCSRY